MSKDTPDIVSIIHHFDHTLSFLRIIAFNSDTYLGTPYMWSMHLVNALLHGEDNG